jgi:hypothetical protein
MTIGYLQKDGLHSLGYAESEAPSLINNAGITPSLGQDCLCPKVIFKHSLSPLILESNSRRGSCAASIDLVN